MKLLAIAYACEPGEGSEPGAGWMWARMLARHGEVWVITRANNRDRIESAIGDIPEREGLHMVYVDLPRWARFWKRGARGLRPYYLMWLLAALRTGRRLHRTTGFDLVWHLTLANAWLGSSAALVGPPFVFGPIGGGVAAPWRLVWPTGLRSSLSELVRAAGRGAGRYGNPLARLAWGRAVRILVQNPETVAWLPRRHRGKTRVFPNVVFSSPPERGSLSGQRPRTAVFAGRLIPWKGADLAIEAIRKTPNWRLVVFGEGSDELRLRRQVGDANLLDRIDFRGRVDRLELLQALRTEAGVFLFPSWHDEAGWVVAEAVAAGVPVVCLDRGGPPRLSQGFGIAVPTGDRETVTSRLAEALERARMMSGRSVRLGDEYWIDRRAQMLPSVVSPWLRGTHIQGVHDGARTPVRRDAARSTGAGG